MLYILSQEEQSAIEHPSVEKMHRGFIYFLHLTFYIIIISSFFYSTYGFKDKVSDKQFVSGFKIISFFNKSFK